MDLLTFALVAGGLWLGLDVADRFRALRRELEAIRARLARLEQTLGERPW